MKWDKTEMYNCLLTLEFCSKALFSNSAPFHILHQRAAPLWGYCIRNNSKQLDNAYLCQLMAVVCRLSDLSLSSSHPCVDPCRPLSSMEFGRAFFWLEMATKLKQTRERFFVKRTIFGPASVATASSCWNETQQNFKVRQVRRRRKHGGQMKKRKYSH